MVKFEMGFGFLGCDKVIVETEDFEIAAIIRGFIDFQESYGWCVDYKAVDFDDEDEDIEYDEDGIAWWEDEDGTWYFFDEESEEWLEWDESYEEVEEENSSEE